MQLIRGATKTSQDEFEDNKEKTKLEKKLEDDIFVNEKEFVDILSRELNEDKKNWF